MHGTWDVSTPFENALELVPFFPNSRFVRVVGGSHGALGEALEESDEFREALWHYAKTADSSRLPTEVQLPPIDWVVP